MNLRQAIVVAALVSTAAFSSAAIVTRKIEYKHGDTVLEGFVAFDDAKAGPRPAVMIVHDWNGTDAYEEGRARQLAEMGYVGFAADIYGKGVRPKNSQESSAEAGKYRQNPTLFRDRLRAGLDAMKSLPQVDKNKTAAIGYCFGGGGVLELARSGADIDGVVSFHGSVGANTPAKEGDIKGKVLVVHAADDPGVPQPVFLGFLKEMKDAKVDYQAIVYNLAVHAFTVPGAQYNASADKRSWEAMQDFLKEIFA